MTPRLPPPHSMQGGCCQRHCTAGSARLGMVRISHGKEHAPPSGNRHGNPRKKGPRSPSCPSCQSWGLRRAWHCWGCSGHCRTMILLRCVPFPETRQVLSGIGRSICHALTLRPCESGFICCVSRRLLEQAIEKLGKYSRTLELTMRG